MKLSKVLLMSTALSVLPAMIFAMEKNELFEDESGGRINLPSGGKLRILRGQKVTECQEAKPEESSSKEKEQIDLNGLSREVSNALGETVGIAPTFNWIEASVQDVYGDSEKISDWKAEFSPVIAFFNKALEDLDSQRKKSESAITEFYADMKRDPAERALVKVVDNNINLFDDEAPGTEQVQEALRVLSNHLFDAAALLEADKKHVSEAKKAKEEASKESYEKLVTGHENYIKTHAQVMFMAIVSAEAAVQKLAESINKILTKHDELKSVEKTNIRATGNYKKENDIIIATRQKELKNLIAVTQADKEKVEATLRAPNNGWLRSSRIDEVKAFYNPLIQADNIADTYEAFMGGIFPGEFNQDTFRRREQILNLSFVETDDLSFADFMQIGREIGNAKIAAEKAAAEAIEKAKVEADAKALAEASVSRGSGRWFGGWWGGSSKEAASEAPAPVTVVTTPPTVPAPETPAPVTVVTEVPAPVAVVTTPVPAPVTEVPAPVAVVTEVPAPVAVVTETPAPKAEEAPPTAPAPVAVVTTPTMPDLEPSATDTANKIEDNAAAPAPTQEEAVTPVAETPIEAASVTVSTVTPIEEEAPAPVKPSITLDLKLQTENVAYGMNLTQETMETVSKKAATFLNSPKDFKGIKNNGLLAIHELISHNLASMQEAFERSIIINNEEAFSFTQKLAAAKESLENEATKRKLDLSKKK